MGRYQVRVQIDIDGDSAWKARTAVEDKLREDFARWRIVGLTPEGAKPRRRPERRTPKRDQMVGGSVFTAALVGWWLWFWLTLP